jgi:hypothetical protein
MATTNQSGIVPGPVSVFELGGTSSPTPVIAYGDLDGTGHDTAGIGIGCGIGGSARLGPGYLIYNGNGGHLNLLGTVSRQYPNADVASVEIQPGRIVSHEEYPVGDDPHCCPSGRATTVWSYKGGKLVPGSPQVTP